MSSIATHSNADLHTQQTTPTQHRSPATFALTCSQSPLTASDFPDNVSFVGYGSMVGSWVGSCKAGCLGSCCPGLISAEWGVNSMGVDVELFGGIRATQGRRCSWRRCCPLRAAECPVRLCSWSCGWVRW
ncbi:hypothetical protein Drorol1_Dr00011121 [Drosera rotundifolia]